MASDSTGSSAAPDFAPGVAPSFLSLHSVRIFVRDLDRSLRFYLDQLGFNLIVCPLAGLLAAAKAIGDVLAELRERETTAGVYDRLIGFDEFNELVELEARYSDEARYA